MNGETELLILFKKKSDNKASAIKYKRIQQRQKQARNRKDSITQRNGVNRNHKVNFAVNNR